MILKKYNRYLKILKCFEKKKEEEKVNE